MSSKEPEYNSDLVSVESLIVLGLGVLSVGVSILLVYEFSLISVLMGVLGLERREVLWFVLGVFGLLSLISIGLEVLISYLAEE